MEVRACEAARKEGTQCVHSFLQLVWKNKNPEGQVQVGSCAEEKQAGGIQIPEEEGRAQEDVARTEGEAPWGDLTDTSAHPWPVWGQLWCSDQHSHGVL